MEIHGGRVCTLTTPPPPPPPSEPRMEIPNEASMEIHGGGRVCTSATPPPSEREDNMDLRRGPWTVEEDLMLMNYIAEHGEGRWNALARCAGLKRTGKSCRLRWLNYLRPDVRRGNITPEEQLLILELHSRWGNRWSKIAQHLPGRTDNEIKNYWRTRVQKHAKQLRCDVDSKQFKDVMRYLWMPRLIERIRAASSGSSAVAAAAGDSHHHHQQQQQQEQQQQQLQSLHGMAAEFCRPAAEAVNLSPESCSMGGGSSTSESVYTPHMDVVDCLADCYGVQGGTAAAGGGMQGGESTGTWWPEPLPSPGGYAQLGFADSNQQSALGEVPYEDLWSLEDIWSVQHLL